MKYTLTKNVFALLLCLSHHLHCSNALTTDQKVAKKNTRFTTGEYAKGVYFGGVALTFYSMYSLCSLALTTKRNEDGTYQEDIPFHLTAQMISGICIMLGAMPFISDTPVTPDESDTAFSFDGNRSDSRTTSPTPVEKNSEESEELQDDTTSSSSEADTDESLSKAYRNKRSACTKRKTSIDKPKIMITAV